MVNIWKTRAAPATAAAEQVALNVGHDAPHDGAVDCDNAALLAPLRPLEAPWPRGYGATAAAAPLLSALPSTAMLCAIDKIPAEHVSTAPASQPPSPKCQKLCVPAVALPARPTTGDDWLSLFAIYVLTIVAEAARGLLLPSLWPYCRAVGGSKDTLGILIAAYSFGRMLSTIPLGYLSDHTSAGFVLVVASILQAGGHLAYCYRPTIVSLCVTRAVIGFGSATTSVARAHVARAIPHERRTQHFAYLSGIQFVGIAVLPACGGLLSLLPESSMMLPLVPLNGFTYPAIILVVGNLLCAAVVIALYKDPAPSSPSTSPQVVRGGDRPPRSFVQQGVPNFLGLVICLLVNVVYRGVLAGLETVSIPFIMEQFSVSYGAGSYFLSAVGILGLFLYLSFRPIARRYSDRSLVAVGLFFIVLGCVPLSIGTLSDNMSIVTYVTFLGFTWSVAYPLGQTATLSLFSKMLGSLPAGGFLGIYSATGALSPLLLSLAAAKLWNDYGRESVYMLLVAFCALAAGLVAAFYRRLAPPLPMM